MPFKPLTGSSDEQKWAAATDMFREVYARESVEIFKDDTGTRRVLLGRAPNGFYGLKVSQPGFDVFDTGDENLGFNSDNNVFKVVDSDTITVLKAANTYSNSTTIAHGLGYSPAFIAYTVANTGIRTQVPWYGLLSSTSGQIADAYYAEVDDTNFTATVLTPNIVGGQFAAVFSIEFKYYLFRETAN